MMYETAYLGLGSNLGDRLAFLLQALELLQTHRVRITRTSRLYQTEPMYVTKQPGFLNAVVAIQTTLSPLQCLDLLLDIEAALGRAREQRYGPRTIDLDLLLWGRHGEVVLQTDRLTLPHPRLPERAFVLVPLAELAPDLVHPTLQQSIGTLLSNIDRSGIQMWKDPSWIATTIRTQTGPSRKQGMSNQEVSS